MRGTFRQGFLLQTKSLTRKSKSKSESISNKLAEAAHALGIREDAVLAAIKSDSCVCIVKGSIVATVPELIRGVAGKCSFISAEHPQKR